MKKKTKILFVLVMMLLIIVTILYLEKLKIIRLVIKEKKALNEQKINTELTTIDVTELVSGQEIEHECIYKTQYDKNNHWNQCIICDKKQNIEVHNYITKWVSRK